LKAQLRRKLLPTTHENDVPDIRARAANSFGTLFEADTPSVVQDENIFNFLVSPNSIAALEGHV
jgi:hypothetical protein